MYIPIMQLPSNLPRIPTAERGSPAVPMAKDPPSPPPTKRLKTLTPDSVKNDQSPPANSQAFTMEGPESSPCGICLSDNDKAIRAQIDSCDHFFCFVCIMEWAKVESRCPLCKRRFSTIRRPPKPGVFPTERVVHVPKRDQVYHLYGNVTVASSDPFANVKCGLCQSSADESLLLLCDLCDSAAHTFCVGLGATVPEGDWFCHDCAVSRTEHDNVQKDGNGDETNVDASSDVRRAGKHYSSSFDDFVDYQIGFGNSDAVVEAPDTDVLISSIVHESDYPSNHVGQLRGNASAAARGTQDNLAAEQCSADNAAQSEARTLKRCCNVHGYIQALRENWSALQNQSLSFASRSSEQLNHVAVSNKNSSLPHSTSTACDRKRKTQDGYPRLCRKDKSSHDIDKAWKMFDRVKSIRQDCGRPSIDQHASKHSLTRGNTSKKSATRSLSSRLSENQCLGTWDLRNTTCKKQCKHHSVEKEVRKHMPLNLEKQNQKCMVESSSSSQYSHPSEVAGSGSSEKMQISILSDVCHGNGARLKQCNLNEVSSNFFKDQNGSTHSITLIRSATGVSELANPRPGTSAHSRKGKLRSVERCSKGKTRKDDDAKSEIQSLVKQNLKLLSRGKQLGVDMFKEIARVATHSILAACRLEHSKHIIRSFPSSVCSHSEQIRKFNQSTLMPNSCRECFCAFVKDVVNSILSEKLRCANC